MTKSRSSGTAFQPLSQPAQAAGRVSLPQETYRRGSSVILSHKTIRAITFGQIQALKVLYKETNWSLAQCAFPCAHFLCWFLGMGLLRALSRDE